MLRFALFVPSLTANTDKIDAGLRRRLRCLSDFLSAFYADKIAYRAGLRKLAEKLCPMREGLLPSVSPPEKAALPCTSHSLLSAMML